MSSYGILVLHRRSLILDSLLEVITVLFTCCHTLQFPFKGTEVLQVKLCVFNNQRFISRFLDRVIIWQVVLNSILIALFLSESNSIRNLDLMNTIQITVRSFSLLLSVIIGYQTALLVLITYRKLASVLMKRWYVLERPIFSKSYFI